MSSGRVVQVIGPVIDVEFAREELPEIYNALILEIEVMGEKRKIVCEVQQHLGGNRVRARSMIAATADGSISDGVPPPKKIEASRRGPAPAGRWLGGSSLDGYRCVWWHVGGDLYCNDFYPHVLHVAVRT